MSSTVVGNGGGGESAVFNWGDFAARNTLIDGGCSVAGPATAWSGGHNIESPAAFCGLDQPTDQVNVAAEQLNIGELADNGGPTKTHALLFEPVVSVAIDAIPVEDCDVETDQRGEPREGRCDVGAFEAQQPCSSASGGCL